MPPTSSPPRELLRFTPGQSVTILAPDALMGKGGIIVGPVEGQDGFLVRLNSGRVLNFWTQDLVAEASASADEGESAFALGQQVFILAPHAMQGNTGAIAGPNPLQKGSWHVKLEKGWMTTVHVSHLRVPRHVMPRYVASKARPATSSSSTTAPVETTPAVAFIPRRPTSKAGTSVPPPRGSVFNFLPQNLQKTRASASPPPPRGSVFNFLPQNLQDMGATATTESTTAPKTPPEAEEDESWGDWGFVVPETAEPRWNSFGIRDRSWSAEAASASSTESAGGASSATAMPVPTEMSTP